MRVQIKLLRAYEVSVDGRVLGRFDEVSAWNGMLELRDAKGHVLIVEPVGTYSTLLADAIGNSADADVVRASVALIGDLTKKATPHHNTTTSPRPSRSPANKGIHPDDPKVMV